MKSTPQPFLALYLALTLAALTAAACHGNAPASSSGIHSDCPASRNTSPAGATATPPPDPASPVTASFTVTINPRDPSLAGVQREPQTAPLAIQTVSGSLRAWGGVKSFVKYPGRLYVELYFINDDKVGVQSAEVTVSNIQGSADFYDFNDDPWAAPTTATTMLLGGIAPEGVERLTFGFDADAAMDPISFQVDLAGTTTSRAAVSSSPIRVTPDGSEVWAVQGDSDLVAVLDTATDTRVAQIKTIGHPSSVAITPDGTLALVTCSACNQLSVIDRRSRQVLQVFGEAEGIGRDPRHVLVSSDGTRAYVSAYVGDSVTALERVGNAFRVVTSIAVGRRPVGLGLTPDGGTLYAAHFMPRGPIEENGGWVSVVDTTALAALPDVDLMDDGNVDAAACAQQITGFNTWTATDLSFEGAPTQLAGVFFNPSGSSAWIPGLRIGPFPIFEGDVEKIGFTFATLGANSPAALWPLLTRDPRGAHVKKLESLIDVSDRDESFLRCVSSFEESEAVIAFPVPGSPATIQNPGTVLPSVATPLSETGASRFVGFTRGGRRALVLSYLADELMVVDAATHSPTSQHYFLLSGSNPTGVAVTPDGAKGYVVYDNSLFVSVLDLSAYATPLPAPQIVPYRFDYSAPPGQTAGLITSGAIERTVTGVPDLPSVTETKQVPLVDSDPLDPVTRRGRILFSSSSPVKYSTLSGNREAACAACHPNGGNDGSVWPTMEGERRTIGLWGGVSGRGWLHASATHQDVTTFATTIVKERLGGTGLSADDVHALSQYVATGIPAVQRPVVDATLVAEGQAIFARRCKSCHTGDLHTSGNPDPSSPYGGGQASGPTLLDVGSTTSWAHAVLGQPFADLFPSQPKQILLDLRGDRALGAGDPVQATLMFDQRPIRAPGQLKAPSLVNEWENVLFFHDGRAATLEDAVSDISMRTGAQLTGNDLAAVVEYLKSL